MSGEGLHRIRERLQQIRAARHATIAAALENAQQVARAAGGTPVAGDRVFDTVTGQEGIVLHAARENIVVPAVEQPDR